MGGIEEAIPCTRGTGLYRAGTHEIDDEQEANKQAPQ
jgi:hypothetical protein